jgi:hypothetical protein
VTVCSHDGVSFTFNSDVESMVPHTGNRGLADPKHV